MPAKKTDTTVTKQELIKENEELRRQIKDIKKNQDVKDKRKEHENRKKYLSLFDNILNPVFIYDAATYKFLHWNKAAREKYGYSGEEILDMTPFDLHQPEDFEKVRKGIDKTSGDTSETFTHFTKERRPRIVEIMTEEIYFDGTPAWMRITHDITEHITMEEELQRYRHRLEEMVDERTVEVLLANKQLKAEIRERQKAELSILESEKKFRNMIEKSRDGVLLVDEAGSIIEWNEGQEGIYGVTRAMVIGSKVWDVLHRHEPAEKRTDKNYKKRKELWEKFFKTRVNPFREDLQVSQIELLNGDLRDIQQLYFTIETDRGKMMTCTTRDITTMQMMEKQLFQAQKMEALGTLAGGIAHDFNNVLGAIMGYTQLALRKVEEESPVQKYLKQVNTASKRASDLVKQILTFSRQEKREKEPLQIGIIVKEVTKLIRSSMPATIEIVTKIEAEKSFVLADPTQVHQVLMNLCTNAGHAMKEQGGTLEVRLTEEEVETGLYKDLKPGLHLRLSVSDTGYGIEQKIRDKIFEPFFTTKAPGEGTGMGLAVAHGIIRSHNGHISVYSKEGEGTTFSILLPVIVNVIHKKTQEGEETPTGSENILLVEDYSPLLEAEKSLLEELGYKVTAVTSGVEAFEIFKSVPDRFAIVITDFIMAKMTGAQLIRQVHDIKPNLPAILCTGYGDVISQQKADVLGIGDIVMKPIDLGRIAKSIRKLIDEK
ncbi:MAG: PAS domain S-box protein [Candidatus Aminicenantes bacterium]|nr:PAS domain S-box protein [Candidatus Aminicenantes bacterium]